MFLVLIFTLLVTCTVMTGSSTTAPAVSHACLKAPLAAIWEETVACVCACFCSVVLVQC